MYEVQALHDTSSRFISKVEVNSLTGNEAVVSPLDPLIPIRIAIGIGLGLNRSELDVS